MKILITIFAPPSGAMGPHTRTVAVGIEAMTKGHQVAFCCQKKLASPLIAQGFTVYEVPESTVLGLPEWISDKIAKKMMEQRFPVKEGKSIGNIWLVLTMMGMASKKFANLLVKKEMEAVDHFKPDVLFTEMDPAVYLVSEISGIPLATTFAKAALEGVGTWPYRKISRRADRILKSYGKKTRPFIDLCFGKNILKIMPTIPELDGTDPEKPDVSYVGHLLSSAPSKKDLPFVIDENKKYVFIYVGTGSVPFKLLENVLPKIFSPDKDYICIVASEVVGQDYQIGAVKFFNYVPADKLFPHCSWTICHGGHNTIIQSVLFGVPLFVFPGPVFERRFNARMVEKAGTGFFGEGSDFSLPWFEEKLDRYEEVKNKCRELAKKIEAYGGPSRAVKELEHFVEKR